MSDEEVDQALEELRQARVRLVVEEGREAPLGDVVVADIEGTPPEGEPFQRERIPIEIGASKHNLPAFNEKLVGVEAGAELEFSGRLSRRLRIEESGRHVGELRLQVSEVKRPAMLPELDDEFAKDLGEFEDLAALAGPGP